MRTPLRKRQPTPSAGIAAATRACFALFQDGAQVKKHFWEEDFDFIAMLVYLEPQYIVPSTGYAPHNGREVLHAHSIEHAHEHAHIWTRQNFVDSWQLAHIGST